MKLGLHTTLDDANSILDPEVIAVAERITPLQSPEFGRVWDLFTVRAEPFKTDEYEILTRAYTAPEIILGTISAGNDWDSVSDTTALPVTVGTIDRITIGDILLVDSEIVVVKAVDRTGNTIDVYERGAGDTNGATHTSATVAKVIGNTHEEGKVQGEAMAEDTGKLTNYCQLVEEVIDLSKANTDQARKVGRTEDVLKAEAMERITRDLARSAIYGVARVNTSTIPAMSRGLLSHLNDVAGAIKTSVGGAFTETALKNILDDVRSAGGSVNAIVLSVANKRIANGFTGADAIQVDRGERVGGHVLDGYIADGFGTIPFIVDIDMPNDKVAVVNTRFMSKGWKENDQLRFVEETNTNSRERKQTLQGKFGFAIEGVGKTHGLLTNIS
jgi:hypothetical protein